MVSHSQLDRSIAKHLAARQSLALHAASETVAANTATRKLWEARRRLLDVEAERDRYRKALAEIAALPRPAFQSERTWREVALEALRDA